MSNAELLVKLRSIPMLKVDEAIKALGDEDIYVTCVEDYYLTLASMRDSIKEYFVANDIPNYVIKVHGLKSSSRLIGAYDLGELAYTLEMSGKNNDTVTIKARTGELILMTCNLEDELKGLFDSDDSDKPLIDENELNTMLTEIIDCAESFDFDIIDEIMDKLSAYAMPENFVEKYKRLKTLVADVARDDIISLIG